MGRAEVLFDDVMVAVGFFDGCRRDGGTEREDGREEGFKKGQILITQSQ